jgi:hypothetical protein
VRLWLVLLVALWYGRWEAAERLGGWHVHLQRVSLEEHAIHLPCRVAADILALHITHHQRNVALQGVAIATSTRSLELDHIARL